MRKPPTVRIAIDALPLQVRSAGIAVYTDQLVRALAAAYPDIELVLFGMRGVQLLADRTHGRGADYPNTVRWATSAWYPIITGMPIAGLPRLAPLEWALDAPTLYHATNYAAPRTRRTPVVVTVHDLALLRFPELGTPALRRMIAALARAVHSAAAVIADSATTAADVETLLGVAAEKIRVVHLGCDPRFAPVGPAPETAAVLRRYGVTAPYLLHVGTIEPRKNLAMLVRAFARVCAARGLPHRLVLAGDRGWGMAAVEQAVRTASIGERVVFTGPISAADLPALYGGAELFVYPSLYEGFGLPVVEAMACGTPVLTSTAGSLPEIAADAARCIEPRDTDGWAAAIAELLDDRAQRRLLVERGHARAAQFTWARCARQTFAVYEEVRTGLLT